MLTILLTNLFDGIAYGMLLFVMACGLSVTLGLMNFVNLAHGAFAMAGGYITVVLVNRLGVPFLLGLPLAFVFSALVGLALERTLYIHVYTKTHLEQVLFSIGLVFMSVAGVDYVMGSQQQFVSIPSYLQGQINLFGVGIGRYRLMIVAICGLLTVALQFSLAKTRFGSRLRAAVDDARVARGLGINVNAVFAVTFAIGSGLAGLGGALSAEILGLDPHFPLKFMIYFLIVVTVGGTSSITGPFIASLLLGIGDVAGKYVQGFKLFNICEIPIKICDIPRFSIFNYDVRIPNNFGAFIIYIIMIVVLIWRPQGLFSRAIAK